MRLVIVTGMSGGGKSTAIKMLEDGGFYCVDNLPIPLIEKFFELSFENPEVKKVAIGVDIRAGLPFGDICEQLKKLKSDGYVFDILFMDALDSVLLKRYKETRRLHPLAYDGRIEDGISREREILSKMMEMSDYIIDTSYLLVRDLKAEMDRLFVYGDGASTIIVNIVSFGFKHGILMDADLVFDVRFLPNPFYIEELKTKTGLDEAVNEYVMQQEGADSFLEQVGTLVDFLIPYFIKEGKYQLIIGIGCTGGKHRSVTLARELHKLLAKKNHAVKIAHRDLERHGT